MSVFEFDLIVSGLDLEDDVAKLDAFEECVGDVTFASHGGVVRAAVERVAGSLGEAIRTAVDDVESIPGASVMGIEPDEYVSQAEIAVRLGRSRQSVSQWIAGVRGPGGFPPPAFQSGKVALWRWSTVSSWLRAVGLLAPGEADRSSVVIAAANALLHARRMVAALDEQERASLSGLLA
jgi:hypothetical protein